MQERTDDTDAQCEAAKAAWDALTDAQKELVEMCIRDSTTAMRLSNQSSAKNFVAIMKDESRANEAKAVVESGLYDLLKSDNAYYIYSASEWLEEMNEMINMVIIIPVSYTHLDVYKRQGTL